MQHLHGKWKQHEEDATTTTRALARLHALWRVQNKLNTQMNVGYMPAFFRRKGESQLSPIDDLLVNSLSTAGEQPTATT